MALEVLMATWDNFWQRGRFGSDWGEYGLDSCLLRERFQSWRKWIAENWQNMRTCYNYKEVGHERNRCQNCIVRHPKMASLLMWPKGRFHKDPKMYLCQIKSSKSTKYSNNFMLYRLHHLHPLLPWNSRITLRNVYFKLLILRSLTVHLITYRKQRYSA